MSLEVREARWSCPCSNSFTVPGTVIHLLCRSDDFPQSILECAVILAVDGLSAFLHHMTPLLPESDVHPTLAKGFPDTLVRLLPLNLSPLSAMLEDGCSLSDPVFAVFVLGCGL